MSCAGIIAASHTTDSLGVYDPNSGIISLDPYVSILPMMYADHSFLPSVYGILRDSAVRSFSWGNLAQTPDVPYGYGRVDAFRAVLSISRGNVDNDPNQLVDIGDLTVLISYLMISFEEPFPSPLLGDCDCNGIVDIGDVTFLRNYLYQGGPSPKNPCFEFGDWAAYPHVRQAL